MPRGRPKKIGQKMDKDLRIPVTAEQHRLISEAMERRGSEMSSWARPLLLRHAQSDGAEASESAKPLDAILGLVAAGFAVTFLVDSKGTLHCVANDEFGIEYEAECESRDANEMIRFLIEDVFENFQSEKSRVSKPDASPSLPSV